ncbi:hypothetical protein FHR92_002997 [Fontibacillus solani]|uniref:Uncharacterized protein n=1 Tax=Fontibacillus solani TaxID=1572857 RepID=A0A7W3SUT7_9BACL|nr:hypothetical protein [Fontibacillus solani]MBA9086519.1 hypothetical protein [Fontibacillus solani]
MKIEEQFKCVVCDAPIKYKGELCDICEAEVQAEDEKTLSNLKKMIQTANNAAERSGYLHGQIELVSIERVMDAQSIVSVPPGVDRVIGAYYERMTGRKAYY